MITLYLGYSNVPPLIFRQFLLNIFNLINYQSIGISVNRRMNTDWNYLKRIERKIRFAVYTMGFNSPWKVISLIFFFALLFLFLAFSDDFYCNNILWLPWSYIYIYTPLYMHVVTKTPISDLSFERSRRRTVKF